jgi:hypothetical protein
MEYPSSIINNHDVSEIVISSTGNHVYDLDVETRRCVQTSCPAEPNAPQASYKWPTIWVTSSSVMGYVDIERVRFGNEISTTGSDELDAQPQRNIGIGGTPVTSMVRAGNVVTISSSPVPHGLSTGSTIQLLEPTDSSFTLGTWTAVTVLDQYTYTFAQAAANATAPVVGGMAAVAVTNTSGWNFNISKNYFMGTESTMGPTQADSGITLFNPIYGSQFIANRWGTGNYNTAKVNDEYFPGQGSSESFGNVWLSNTQFSTFTAPDFANGGKGWAAVGTLPFITINNGANGNGVTDNTYQCGLTGDYDCYLMTVKNYTGITQFRFYRSQAGSFNLEDYTPTTPVSRFSFAPGGASFLRPGAAGQCVDFQNAGGTSTLFQSCDTQAVANVPLQESKTTVHDSGDVARGVRDQIAPTAHSVGIILGRAAVTSDEMARASVAQKQYWGKISEQTADAIGDTQDTVKKMGEVADAAKAQIAPIATRFQTTLDDTNTLLSTTNEQVAKAGPLMVSATSFVGHADKALTNPELAASMVNFQRISGAWAGMSEDAQKKLHATLYPAKPSGFGMVMEGVRMAGPVGEVLYYFSNIRR